uniref:receptor-like protein EIX2 n=1 Tax=Erigeron canadensis TaxID=72917 RepID=UPI001CB8B23A|nr:receptor-like protein EIX2 [Erigeron canadensis]XP_043612829.1 receptor-like protein EIX2 [Erigeron canadensis]
MTKLESLDLSENHLEGKFPLSLSRLTSLNSLNVSYNNLEGKIPTGPQLQTFDKTSFTGNALCGDPLPACVPNDVDTKGSDDDNQDDSNGIDWTLVIFTLVGLVVGFWIIIVPLLVSEQWRNAYYHLLGKMRIKLQDLLLRIFRCFRMHRPPPQIVLSSSDHAQRYDLSQYIIDQPEGSKQQAESSNYEASSMAHSIQ